MKLLLNLLKAFGLFLLILLIIVGVAMFVLAKMPAVGKDYYQKTQTGGPIEAKYTAMGPHQIKRLEYKINDYPLVETKKNDGHTFNETYIWYPIELENSDKQYPVVVMANGTGVKALKYEAIFEHLASWGFIVIGNDDESSWDGISSHASLEVAILENANEQSVFYQKVDVNKIGVTGHSQGGVGAINAAKWDIFKTLFIASTTHKVLADALEWPYDPSLIQVPTMMVAGTLQGDAGDGKENYGIAPLESLQFTFNAIDNEIPKVLARRNDADHGPVLPLSDGYMTAWMMYWLQGDQEAGKAFFGEHAEITNNLQWQDVQVNE